MGIIQRQSIKGILVFVIGAAIHFITMIFLMPNYLQEQDFAVFRVYFSLILIFNTVGLAGMNVIVLKHLQDFDKMEQEKKIFNFSTLFIAVCTGIVSLIIIYLCKDIIYSFKKTDSPYLMNYFWCVPISTFAFVILSYFEYYSIATHRLTGPSIVKEIFMKIILLLSVIFYWKKLISIQQFFLFYAFSYIIAAITMGIYCYTIRNFRIKIDFSMFKNKQFQSYLPYTFFLFLMSIVSALILNLDQPVVYGLLGSKSTAVYSIAVTIASMITIPYKPLSSILLPFMFEAWKENDLQKLNKINQQSSLYLSVLGVLLYIVLLANTPNLLHFLKPAFALFKWPLIIIGFGRVLDYTTGASTELLTSAPTYKKMLQYMILTFLFSLICYVIFIPTFHEIGAAISCILTLVFFNILKYYHLYTTYNLQPITIKSFIAMLFGAIVLFGQYWIPTFSNIWIDIICRSALVTLLYCSILYFTNLLPEINSVIKKYINVKNVFS